MGCQESRFDKLKNKHSESKLFQYFLVTKKLNFFKSTLKPNILNQLALKLEKSFYKKKEQILQKKMNILKRYLTHKFKKIQTDDYESSILFPNQQNQQLDGQDHLLNRFNKQFQSIEKNFNESRKIVRKEVLIHAQKQLQKIQIKIKEKKKIIPELKLLNGEEIKQFEELMNHKYKKMFQKKKKDCFLQQLQNEARHAVNIDIYQQLLNTKLPFKELQILENELLPSTERSSMYQSNKIPNHQFVRPSTIVYHPLTVSHVQMDKCLCF